MKPQKIASVFLPMLLGVAAARWTTLDFWIQMKEGLIAFLGFLAAAVVQVMPVTANFLQSDRLTPSDTQRLSASLTRQQYYWIGLLSAAIAAMVIVIVGAALKDRVADLPPTFRHQLFLEISWAQVVCFLIASSVSFVLAKTLGLFEGIMSLHRLRAEIVLNAAKREAAEQVATLQKQISIPNQLVPPEYGQLIRPH